MGIVRCSTAMLCSEYRMVSTRRNSIYASHERVCRMCCARIINGIGTGHLNAIVPVWSAEVASHTSRGAFIASEFTLNIFGVVVAYWLEFGLGYVGDGNTQVRWRVRDSGLKHLTCEILIHGIPRNSSPSPSKFYQC